MKVIVNVETQEGSDKVVGVLNDAECEYLDSTFNVQIVGVE